MKKLSFETVSLKGTNKTVNRFIVEDHFRFYITYLGRNVEVYKTFGGWQTVGMV